MAMSKTTDLAVALLGAAGGALAVYLLDPQAGGERRKHLSAVARDAVEQAREHLEPLIDRAHEVVAGKVSEAVGPVQEAAKSHIADAANVASDARRVASRAVADAHSALEELRHRGRRAASALRGEQSSSHVLPVALSAVGFCAAGVGLMWLLDPDRGRARRAQVGQQAQHILNQTSRTFHSTGRHLRNKLMGLAAVTERNLRE